MVRLKPQFKTFKPFKPFKTFLDRARAAGPSAEELADAEML
jgi:hypothetical protein